MLRDDPLELTLRRGAEERLALADDMVGVSNARLRSEDTPEQGLALFEWDLEQRPAVEVEEVEGLVDERRFGGPRRATDPLVWSRLEGRRAVGVERDHLAVDDRALRLDPGSAGDSSRGKYVSASLPRRVWRRTRSPSTTASTR